MTPSPPTAGPRLPEDIDMSDDARDLLLELDRAENRGGHPAQVRLLAALLADLQAVREAYDILHAEVKGMVDSFDPGQHLDEEGRMLKNGWLALLRRAEAALARSQSSNTEMSVPLTEAGSNETHAGNRNGSLIPSPGSPAPPSQAEDTTAPEAKGGR